MDSENRFTCNCIFKKEAFTLSERGAIECVAATELVEALQADGIAIHKFGRNTSNKVREFLDYREPADIDASLNVAIKRIYGAAFKLIQEDPHQWSKRPCSTCMAVSLIIGESFGCEVINK